LILFIGTLFPLHTQDALLQDESSIV